MLFVFYLLRQDKSGKKGGNSAPENKIENNAICDQKPTRKAKNHKFHACRKPEHNNYQKENGGKIRLQVIVFSFFMSVFLG